jgi:type IV secretion system protein VirB8
MSNKTGLSKTPGKSFEAILSYRAYKSEKRAWIVAGTSAIIATIAVTAVAVMVPLKQVVPHLIYVDKETGATQVVSVVDSRTVGNDEINARYWLARYVKARESYLYKLLQEDYDLTMALSAPNVGADYSAIYEGTNNKSTRLVDAVEERVHIISAEPTPGVTGRGTVRFEKTTWRVGLRQAEKTETYQADIAFEWKPITGWSVNDLLKNPLGFAVTAYRSTPEIVGPR